MAWVKLGNNIEKIVTDVSKYTSIFNFSADKKLTTLEVYWILINLINNSFPNFNIDKKLIIRKYKKKKITHC